MVEKLKQPKWMWERKQSFRVSVAYEIEIGERRCRYEASADCPENKIEETAKKLFEVCRSGKQ